MLNIFYIQEFLTNNMDSISVSDSDSDTDRRPNVMAQNLQNSINQTAASFKEGFGIDDDNGLLYDAGQTFSNFYNEKLLRNRSIESQKLYFQDDDRIFGPYRKRMRIYRPSPDLYFLPITIIFTKRVDLLALRDKIVKHYSEAANTIFKQSKTQRTDGQITVCVHTEWSLNYYRIRNIAIQLPSMHKKPECLEKDLCLNILFDFYAKNYDRQLKFSETCGYILYWAYRKNMLNDQYFHENVLKIFVVFFFISSGMGISNVAYVYNDKQKLKLSELKKKYTISKDLTCKLDQDLFQQWNFAIREKNGFYIESKKRYAKIQEIMPIPFPVEDTEIKKYNALIQKPKSSYKSNSCTRFISIMKMLHNFIQRAEKITLDLLKKNSGFQETIELDFDLEVIHPVFRYNMCQQITGNPSKIRKLKHQINSIAKFMKESRNDHEALKLIFMKL